MSDMNDLVYNPVTGMFERRRGSAQNNPNMAGQPEWNPQGNAGTAQPRPQPQPQLPPLPVINTFQRRGEPMAGKRCKFIWNVSHATSLRVTGLGDLPMSNTGSCMIMMGTTPMAITLTASNARGIATRTLKVYPGGLDSVPLPVINYFRKVGDARKVGDEFILEWEVSGAKEVYLTGPRTMHVLHQGTSHVNIEDQPRTYTLTASNEVGKEISQEIVIEAAKPDVKVFRSSNGDAPAEIGSMVTLSWEVEDCQQVKLSSNGVTIEDRPFTSSGSIEVKVVDENPVVNLEASNSGVYNRSAITIKTPKIKAPAFSDISFQTINPPLFVGDEVRLFWKAEDAESVEVSQGDNVLFREAPMGSRKLFVTAQSMQLRFKARNRKYEAEKLLNIEAKVLPSITKMESSVSVCKTGDDVTITWTTEHADSVTLNGAPAALEGNMPVTVMSNRSTVTLRAFSGEKFVEKKLEITAVSNPQPVINYFRYPEDADRHKGKNVEVEWDVSNAQRVELVFGKSKREKHPVHGSRKIKIMREKFTLKLIAYNGEYTTQSALTIEMEKSIWRKIFGK